MLFLSRRNGEKILLPELGITIVLTDSQIGRAQIGIHAPRHITILREELYLRNLAKTKTHQ